MLKKILNRASEPSSYAGVGAILYGTNELFKIKELEPVIDATAQAGEAVTASGSPLFGLAVLLTGILALFVPEKKR